MPAFVLRPGDAEQSGLGRLKDLRGSLGPAVSGRYVVAFCHPCHGCPDVRDTKPERRIEWPADRVVPWNRSCSLTSEHPIAAPRRTGDWTGHCAAAGRDCNYGSHAPLGLVRARDGRNTGSHEPLVLPAPKRTSSGRTLPVRAQAAPMIGCGLAWRGGRSWCEAQGRLGRAQARRHGAGET